MIATRDQALDYIHQHPEIYLHKAKKKGYICPICGSGSGPNGTGIITKDQVHFTCIVGNCFKWADIPDIIAKKEGLEPGSKEALQAAYNAYGITIADNPLPTGGQSITIGGIKVNTGGSKQPMKANAAQPAKGQEKQQQDYTAYYEECHKRIKETTYPIQRGLTGVSIDRFKLGFDPNFRTKEVLEDGTEQYASWQALIIPNGPYSYTVRNMKPEATDRVRERGPKIPFNLPALEQQEKPVFIVEGEIDALSIIEAGGEAVALRGTASDGLISELEKKGHKYPLLLSLDKDNAGRAAESKLLEALTARKIPFLQADIAGDYKDANEALTNNTAAFVQAVYMAQQSILSAGKEAEEAERKAYISSSAAGHMAGFKGLIASSINTKPMLTTFTALDRCMDGGLYEGLYTIGGGTSTGKTTLALQIADNVAQQGNDVLIFSLEMARYELMARSISRLTLINCLMQGKPTSNAKTTRDILRGERHLHFNQLEMELYDLACNQYEEYANRIYISEGIGDIGVTQIRAGVEKHLSLTGNRPLVLVDYLQLLSPHDPRATDKQNTDKAVLELKRISRDYKIPVIAVSSLNRANYQNAIDLEAFKESGAIEYSSDVVMGLQYEGQGSKIDKAAAQQQKQRKMELRILKQRNASTGMSITFDFYSFANYYHETGEKKKSEDKATGWSK